jgi:molecular chaperone HtpG
MKEMQQTGGGGMMMGDMPDMYTLTVNTNHELVGQILSTKTAEEKGAPRFSKLLILRDYPEIF